MNDELLFSIVSHDMHVNNDETNKLFDVDTVEKINIRTQLVPLFNVIFLEDSLWDQMLLEELNIVVSIFENIPRKSFKEIISYEQPFLPAPNNEGIYQLDLDIDLEEEKIQIKSGCFYTIRFSHYFPKLTSNKFVKIIDNTFFVTPVPFKKDGGWYDGKF